MKPRLQTGLVAAAGIALMLASGIPLARLRGAAPAGAGASAALSDAPPLVSFTTVALGGFRGLLVDVLWCRMAALQDEGRCFEIVQLADWVTKLEPTSSAVWAYHSWNMAYNISVMFPAPQDRWRWVEHGIRLLRDDGVRYCAGDPEIYVELAGLYLQKVGGVADQAGAFYRLQLAAQMTQALGGPRPDYAALRADPAAARAFRERTSLDPALMEETDRAYGPLEWRLPQAHAIHWAAQGRKRAKPGAALRCDRIIYQSLASAFEQGRLAYRPEERLFVLGADLDVLPRALKAFEDTMAAGGDDTVRTAYENFLRGAMLVMFTFNKMEETAGLYERLGKFRPGPETAAPLQAFVLREAARTVRDIPTREAAALIEGACYQGYQWLAAGDAERAAGFDRFAILLWDQYTASKSPELLERVGLPPIEQLRARALERFMQETGGRGAPAPRDAAGLPAGAPAPGARVGP